MRLDSGVSHTKSIGLWWFSELHLPTITRQRGTQQGCWTPGMAATSFKAIHVINGVNMVTQGKGGAREECPFCRELQGTPQRGFLSTAKQLHSISEGRFLVSRTEHPGRNPDQNTHRRSAFQEHRLCLSAQVGKVRTQGLLKLCSPQDHISSSVPHTSHLP